MEPREDDMTTDPASNESFEERLSDDNSESSDLDQMNAIWLELHENLTEDMKSIWSKSLNSIKKSMRVQDVDAVNEPKMTEMPLALALDQMKKRANRDVQILLETRKKVFLAAVEKIQDQYRDKRETVRLKLRQEKQRLQSFFGHLLLEQQNSIHAKVLCQARKMNIVIEDKLEAMEDQLRSPDVIQMKDKIAFFFGVMFICIIEAIMIKNPQWMPTFYLYSIFPLMLLRYITYHQVKYHYFMLDFCYFVQLALIIFLWCPPNQNLFMSLFVITQGPLLWAIPLWGNSLVFHSLDKVTSSFIHFIPMLVTFAIRWYPNDVYQRTLAVAEDDTISTMDVLSYPLALYATWQLFYLFKTEIIDGEKFRHDPALSTSFRYLAVTYRHTRLYTAATIFGPDHLLAGFVSVQGLLTLLWYLPTVVFYSHFYIHLGVICIVFMISVWNGANYYVYQFSKYQHRVKHDPERITPRRAESWYRAWIRRGEPDKSKRS